MAEDEKPKKRGGVSGAMASVIVLFLSVAGWGGLHYYLSTIDKEIATYEVTITANRDKLSGERINRVADFDTRVAQFHADPSETVDPQAVLTKLEGRVLSSVILTAYEYNPKEGIITLGGKTDSFRHLAEQILSFKAEESLAQIKVDTTSRDKSDILFTLKAPFVLK